MSDAEKVFQGGAKDIKHNQNLNTNCSNSNHCNEKTKMTKLRPLAPCSISGKLKPSMPSVERASKPYESREEYHARGNCNNSNSAKRFKNKLPSPLKTLASPWLKGLVPSQREAKSVAPCMLLKSEEIGREA